jgi:hypothetical protein
MNADVVEEMAVGNCLIRLRSARVESPGNAGWVGTWEIYQLPWHRRKRAVHVGETEVVTSERMALGMARTIATAVAFAF